jgi:large repetitive protein
MPFSGGDEPRPHQSASSSPVKADTDGDGLNDLQEVSGWVVKRWEHCTVSATEKYLEQWIYAVSSDPNIADFDNDGLSDGKEYMFTDPNCADTDHDGLSDGMEDANKNGKYEPWLGETNPLNNDCDGDMLYDGFCDSGIDRTRDPFETGIYGTAKGYDGAYGVFNVDDDGNGITDDISEYLWPGSDDVADPAGDNYDFNSNPTGTENNGMKESNELGEDIDCDGVVDKATETDSRVKDCDGDGICDGNEYFYLTGRSIAYNHDSDSDGTIDLWEFDSDGDGLSDGEENTNQDQNSTMANPTRRILTMMTMD